jgi:peptidoglycan/LPS O-acetylase OafA/YrhL
VRRGFKIWPQYYVFLLLILLTRHRSLHDLWGNLLNVQNYTGGIPHTWSLAVEEHAYLLLALGLAWAARLRVPMRTLGFWLAGICAAVVVGRLWLIEHGHEVVNRTHTRIEGILYGVLLAMLFHLRPETFRRWQRAWPVWLGAVGVSLAFFRFQTDAPWSASLGWDAADLLGVALLMLLYRPRQAQRNVVYRLVAAIGVYSYGIYLWHVSVIAPSLAVANRLPHALAPLASAVLPVLGGIVLGTVSTRLIELPALKLRDRLFPRRVDSPVGTPAATEARYPARSSTLLVHDDQRSLMPSEVEQLA